MKHGDAEFTEEELEWRKLVMSGGFLIGGREFAELGDGGGDGFEGVIDFGVGGVAAKAEANAGACVFRGKSNCC